MLPDTIGQQIAPRITFLFLLVFVNQKALELEGGFAFFGWSQACCFFSLLPMFVLRQAKLAKHVLDNGDLPQAHG